ncbi:MAG: preprotein translocase subunit SecE [Bacteroidota bacterium]|nr:preprotein translocase subunit SecE [Bacteroidota bacterium]
MKEKITEFFEGVTKEMKKVTWPTKDELKDSTTIVLASTVIISLFIFMVDAVFTKFLELLLGS